MRFEPPGDCPVCGFDVPKGRRACPNCGADERSGWSEDAHLAELDLPEPNAFDHRGFVRREFGDDAQRHRPLIPKFWLWAAAIVALLMLFAWVILPIIAAHRHLPQPPG
jgi:hypothetical protein